MAAQPYIAQWVGEHPKWTAVRWRCEYPHANDKADKAKLRPRAEPILTTPRQGLLVAVLQILVGNRKHRIRLDLDIPSQSIALSRDN